MTTCSPVSSAADGFCDGCVATWIEGRKPSKAAKAFVAKNDHMQYTVTAVKYNPYKRTGPPGQTWALAMRNTRTGVIQPGLYLTTSPPTYRPTAEDFMEAYRETVRQVRSAKDQKSYASLWGLPYSTHYERGEVSFRYNMAEVIETSLRAVFSSAELCLLFNDPLDTSSQPGLNVDKSPDGVLSTAPTSLHGGPEARATPSPNNRKENTKQKGSPNPKSNLFDGF